MFWIIVMVIAYPIILYFAYIFMKWLPILFDVLNGNKEVIHDFDCHKKDYFWQQVWEDITLCIPENNNDTNRKL